MALATKCPHCNTVFRVAHDQLKLRGGVVRCGSCNEVFDGNAALLEPLPTTPLPHPVAFDQRMAALDTRAAEVLSAEEADPVLELDSLNDEPAADAPTADASADASAADFDAEPDVAAAAAAEIPLPAAPAALPANTEALFDLDLDIESEPDLEASSEPEVSPTPAAEPTLDDVLDVDSMSEDELEAALEAELEAMEQTLADVPHDADGLPAGEDIYAGMSGGRVEPTWDDDALDEPQAGAGPGLHNALAAADAAIFSDDDTPPARAAADDEADAEIDADAAYRASVAAAEANLAAASAEALADTLPAERTDAALPDAESAPPVAATQASTLPPARPLRDDELDEADEEALVHLSSAGMTEAQSASAHAYLHAHSVEEAPAYEDHAQPEEPGFVKRDRQRQKYGKVTTIAMSAGSLLLVGALLLQAVTTFRNALAANMPALKPALTATCQALGCKIELPTQIDDLTIEQGELQTLSDTTFSFTTLQRNQSATAQAWPAIELVLDDDKDKQVLRRVFTPRDYLSADTALDKGFAPHTEQAVKLYFELHDLKASGYHIAVFYP